MVVVLMGVAGAGKTTVGRRLAAVLGWHFIDADDHHASASLAKMAKGEPLTDADRRPWLDALADLVGRSLSARLDTVLACSALKAAYRARLCVGVGVHFVYLKVDRATLATRLAARQGHFFDPSLLPDQLASLEEPVDALVLDAARPASELVDEIRRWLASRPD
jgi:gluconokinase